MLEVQIAVALYYAPFGGAAFEGRGKNLEKAGIVCTDCPERRRRNCRAGKPFRLREIFLDAVADLLRRAETPHFGRRLLPAVERPEQPRHPRHVGARNLSPRKPVF